MFPLASRYTAFHDSVFSGIAEPVKSGAGLQKFGELELQSLWYAGEFGEEFVTADGKRIVIKDFGVWNHAAGPDFTHCALRIGDTLLRGDIELDPDVRDWERHGHGTNPAYAGVVLHLHVTAPAKAAVFIRTTEHREVPKIQLTEELLRGTGLPKPQAEARLGRCAQPLAHLSEGAVSSLLEAAAEYRLQQKSAKLQRLIHIHGRNQALYQALAAALGYRPNQRPFTILTQRLPIKAMLKMPSSERESLLFGTSGFLESVRYEDTLPDTRLYLRALWSEWWKQRHAYEFWMEPPNQPKWALAGIRPGNHPQRRLGTLFAILDQWKFISESLRDAAKWDAGRFSKILLGLTHPYWSQHYTLMAEAAARPVALVGQTRVQEMLANIVYPLLVPEAPSLWADYKKLPAMLDNQKVRRAALRLFGDSARAAVYQKRLFQQQGLIQIYEDYCLEDASGCSDCPFPDRLVEWSN